MTQKASPSHVQEDLDRVFTPGGKVLEGEEARRPQQGKTASTGVAVVKAFAQRYLPLLETPGLDDLVASHHCR